MDITRELKTDPNASIVMAVGAFDGLHLGHQSLITESIRKARANQGRAWVFTFEPHPGKIIAPDTAPALILTTQQKLNILEQWGVDGCFLIPFTPQLAGETPEAFVQRLTDALPQLDEIMVGQNWRFGHRAQGTPDLLKTLGVQYGLKVTILNSVTWDREPVSSTRIRNAVARGNLETARHMLDRPFSIIGTVITGRQIGRALGFPTANIQPLNELKPPYGIYAAFSIVGNRRYNGAAYFGDPELSGLSVDTPIFEIHFFDLDCDLYNHDLEIFLIKLLRPDQRFIDQNELKQQIIRDIVEAKKASKIVSP